MLETTYWFRVGERPRVALVRELLETAPTSTIVVLDFESGRAGLVEASQLFDLRVSADDVPAVTVQALDMPQQQIVFDRSTLDAEEHAIATLDEDIIVARVAERYAVVRGALTGSSPRLFTLREIHDIPGGPDDPPALVPYICRPNRQLHFLPAGQHGQRCSHGGKLREL
jgi:hypothetical protein